MEALIKAQNLNFTYNAGKDNEYRALININLEIYPEEYIIIFGPSGCGKSTLLNLIAGLERPDQETMYIYGKDMHDMTKKDFAMYHRTKVGMIYQQYNLISSLTVLENVALPQVFISVSKGKRNKWSRSLLDRFGILKQAKKIPSELSGGQQQRIGIARSIVNNPDIILADEPIGNLDSVSAKNVLDILNDLNENEKKTVIQVTHNPEHLIYGDRIFYMKDGVITREVVNRDRKKKDRQAVIPKSTTAEINDLMRAYHGLTPEQINILIMPYKAKAFAHHFISSRSLEETRTLEDVIQRRLLGTISQEDFFETLRKSTPEGGVGFDIRTAEKILRRVNRIIRTAYYIYQSERQPKTGEEESVKIDDVNDEEKAKKVSWYLLNSCYFKHYNNLEGGQVARLQLAVRDRLAGEIQKNGFFEQLDKSFKEGGVGLNVKTAKAMAEELELVLILGFGIVQKSSMEEKEKKAAAAESAKEDTVAKTGPAGAASPLPELLSAVAKNIAAQSAPEEGREPDGKVMYLDGQQAADLAESGIAFAATGADQAKDSTAELLAKELEEAEKLNRQSEEALKSLPEEAEALLDDNKQEDDKH